MSPSKILFFLGLSLIAGIFLESIVKIPQIFVWGFLFLGVVITLGSQTFSTAPRSLIGGPVASKKFTASLFGFCLLVFAIGILRVQISEFDILNDKLSKLNGKGQVSLTGIVYDGADVRDTSQKIKVKVENSIVLVTTKIYPEYNYLDKVKITGKLETPMVSDDFNYKNYLLKDHIYSVMAFPKIEIVSKKHQYNIFSYLYEKVLFLKGKLNDSIQGNFSPPHSIILEGIILGNNKNMTPDLREKLSNTGLRFLTAISGVHVIILSAILIYFLMYLGFNRIQSFYFSIIFIWLYIILTGFSASGIRAGIMGSIFIVAGALGRQNTSSRTIVLAASIMLMQNPLLLIYDIGFQLSFMASLGIIYLKPLVDRLVEIIFKSKTNKILDIISVTASAQVFTMPLMIYSFGVVPLMSPVTNILILPIMPMILSFGFISAILGAISKFLGLIFSLPCWILISYFLKVMDIFSQPWMAKTIANVSWLWVLFSYLIIGIVTWFLNKKYGEDFI